MADFPLPLYPFRIKTLSSLLKKSSSFHIVWELWLIKNREFLSLTAPNKEPDKLSVSFAESIAFLFKNISSTTSSYTIFLINIIILLMYFYYPSKFAISGLRAEAGVAREKADCRQSAKVFSLKQTPFVKRKTEDTFNADNQVR